MIRIMLYELAHIAHGKPVRLTDISRATGLSRTTLTKLNQEDSKGISFETLDALCEYFGCQPGDLLRYQE